ncbi:MAG: hypothetical protein LQ342_007661 [Letrouitia transgressa]|nr:MAG: hypothetical protein LQ342_007661 [Letrouitia transgressa]
MAINSSLIAESFRQFQMSSLVLKMHDNPIELFIPESKLLSLLSDSNNDLFVIPNLESSMRYYVRLRGRLGVTPRVLQEAAYRCRGNLRFVWFLWRAQRTVDLATMIRIAGTVTNWLEIEGVLKLLLKHGVDAAIMDAFEAETHHSHHLFYHYQNLYQIILRYVYRGKFHKFEYVFDRLVDSRIPLQELEKFLAFVVGEPPQDCETEEVLEYLVNKFEFIVLSSTFFASLTNQNIWRETVAPVDIRLEA